MKDNSTPRLREVYRALWRCKTYKLLLVFVILNGFVQYGLAQWWPSFYSRVFGLNLTSIGAYLGVALGGGSGVGLLIGGLLSNRAAQRDARLPLMIGAAATLLAIPTALASLFIADERLSILLVALTGMFWSVPMGPVVATVFSVVTSRMRAITGASNAFLISMLGTGLGPFSVGLLSDLLTPSFGEQALRYALLLPVSLFVLMAIALFAAAHTAPTDLRETGAHP